MSENRRSIPSVPNFVVLGNEENRRVAFFQQALARCGCATAKVISYEGLLAGRCDLSAALADADVLRIESPGENFAVEQAMLSLGAADAEAEGSPFLPAGDCRSLTFDRGRILHPRQWYLGFCRVLKQVANGLQSAPGVRHTHDPADIAAMFDKCVCQKRFQEEGIPVPQILGPVNCYDELIECMRSSGHDRVFVKLAHGSSASGVVAVERHGARQRAITSAELVRANGETRLYNSLQVRTYTRPTEIGDLIDAIAPERVQVEAWLSKARLDGQYFDLRVVAIAGRAEHFVVRQSRGPMTNLHLGNRRGDRAAFLKRIELDDWSAVQQTCRRVMECFPRTRYAGIDVALLPNFRDHAVLEVNAFGDLLPGIEVDGRDTYTAEVETLLRDLVPPAAAIAAASSPSQRVAHGD